MRRMTRVRIELDRRAPARPGALTRATRFARSREGFYNVFLDLVDHPGRSIAWDASAITREDGTGFRGRGSADSGLDYGAASDIDHSNAIVVEGLVRGDFSRRSPCALTLSLALRAPLARSTDRLALLGAVPRVSRVSAGLCFWV
jgi:hypothetical protein